MWQLKRGKSPTRKISWASNNIKLNFTVKSGNYESRNNGAYRKNNGIIDDAVMEVSIEKSHNNDKFHYYYGFVADQCLS